MPSGPERNRVLQLSAIAGLLILVDQVSKAIVRRTLAPGSSLPLMDPVLRITFFQNFTGFSWWVPALPPWAGWVLRALLILILLLAFPVYLFYTHTRRQSIWADIALVGLVASCLGHLMDDLFTAYTTDFIQVFNSPSANFADCYAYVAIGALGVEMIRVLRLGKPQWKGFRYLVASGIATRSEFLEFIGKGIRRFWTSRGRGAKNH